MARGTVASPIADGRLDRFAEKSPAWSPDDGVTTVSIPRFRSEVVSLAPVDSCEVRVVEDIAAFAGGAVWRIDWCPTRPTDDGGGAYIAVEANGADDATDTDTEEHRARSHRHASSFDDLGRASGEGVVQIWRIGPAFPDDDDTGAKRKRKPKTAEIGSEARCVLGIAHDGAFTWDLRWSPESQSEPGCLGALAVALGDGRVEAWTVEDVPVPSSKAHRETDGHQGASAMPVAASNAYFRGVPPKESGIALAIDWSPDGDKIAAATSGGAVCVWKVPKPNNERGKGRLSPKPALPHVIVGDVGRPQRCVSWVPDSEQTGGDDAGLPLSLVASIGHCMATPAVYTLDDPFKPAVGARGLAFSGHGAQLGMDWLPHGAGAVTCSAEGSVRLHDFFDKSAVYNRDGDSAGTVNSKAIAWAAQGEDIRKGKSLEKETELSVRGAWCVGAKSIGTSGVAVVACGTGAAGARVAAVHAGHGSRRTNQRNKRDTIEQGAPVDLVPLGGHAISSSGVVIAAAFGQRTKHAPASLGGDGVDVSPVRCARWLDPRTPVDAASGDAWLAWGDDAGFVRFQRIDSTGLMKVEKAMEHLNTKN